MAAAALAAGLLTSNAQVYSQNIVGYVSIPLTNATIQVVSPTLDFDGTGINNTVATVFGTNVAAGDVVYVFNGTGYNSLDYEPVSRSIPTAGWYLGGTVLSNSYAINPGEAVFYLPAANETNVQVGTVLQATNLANSYFPPLANEVGLVSSVAPVSGGVTSVLGYNPSPGDVIYQFNGTGYNSYDYLPVSRSVSTAGWYLGGTTLSEPQIPVGSGFWIQPAEATNWVQNFVVAP